MGSALAYLVMIVVVLIVLAIVVLLLGGACWAALSIWKVVFGFFM